MLVTSSCGEERLRDIFDPKKHDFIDRSQQLNRADYEDMAAPRQGKSPEVAQEGSVTPSIELKPVSGPPPIPDISQILAAPRPPKIGESQLVSIAVTDDVPLKDVLIELARLADVDIELDAGIAGGISFRAKEKPFNEVIDRISDLAGLRYTMKNGVLRVERDVPYIKNYALDFLNINRNSESSVNISTNVLASGSSSGSSSGGAAGGGGGGGGGGGFNTGSSSSITSTTEGDFWSSLEAGLEEILAYEPVKRVSEPMAITPSMAAPIPADPTAVPDPGLPGASTPGAGLGALAPSAGGPFGGASPGGSSGGSKSKNKKEISGDGKTFYIFNRQAGILTVSATDRQHAMIKTFIEKVERSASSQVLIEAKIVEVTLDKQFESGIDWSIMKKHFNADLTFGTVSDPANFVTFGFDDDSGLGLNAVVKLAENFGTTRTLSSPRLHAMNNQQAVLTFAENQVYFDINVQREKDTTASGPQELLTLDSEVKTVPIGIILTIQPSVNTETGEITLSVRPTLSRVTGTVSDPAVAFLAATGGSSVAGIVNRIPVVEVRELDSILKLKSGDVMVIGGLMEQKNVNDESGVPGVSKIPFIGNAFKGVQKQDQTSELIIFIRATIVGNTGLAVDADRSVYKKFFDDPRPLAF